MSQYGKEGAARRSTCRAGARSQRSDPSEQRTPFSGLRRLLQHGIMHHDNAVADPGKQLLKVVPKTIVEKGNRDLAAERKRAGRLSAALRNKVQRHDNAVSDSGKRIQRLPSVNGLVNRGMKDIQTVASGTPPGAPLSEYSDIWTFPIALVTYSTMVMAWAAELAGMFLLCYRLAC